MAKIQTKGFNTKVRLKYLSTKFNVNKFFDTFKKYVAANHFYFITAVS